MTSLVDAAAAPATAPRPATGARAAAAAVALAAAGCGLWLAAHHPLSAGAALAAFAATALAMAVWPLAWPVLLPALWPWLALAPWSGWISFEEVDLLVLAVAAGGYARWALRPLPGRAMPGHAAATAGAWLLWLLWAAAVAVALQRGIADAGGWRFDWYDAYRGPMNALRLAKPTLALLLLLPLWQQQLASADGRADDRLTLGLALAHGGAALACVWERAVYPGLLNFSTDYRTTGLFWEMHVGGAALDGLLALTFPFALRLWWTARSRAGWLAAAAVALLGAYAALTTFSRILLLALPLGVAVMALLQAWPAAPGRRAAAGAAADVADVDDLAPGAGADARRGATATDGPCTGESGAAGRVSAGQWAAAGLLFAGVTAGAVLMFPGAGYRGMLALLGNAALLLLIGPRLPGLGRRNALAAGALALAAAPALLGAATLFHKGPYVVYALVWLAGAAAATGRDPRWRPAALAALLVGWACTVQVAWHWGGERAAAPAALSLLAPALGLLACGLRPGRRCWPDRLRWQAGLLAAMAVAAMLVGMAGGGAYLGERLSTTEHDQQGRWQHWTSALERLPDGRSRLLGVGLGRFLDHYALDATAGGRPGDLRLVAGDDGPLMRMIAGTHVQGWGELMRLSQRIERPLGRVELQLVLRNLIDAELHAEVCLKHLIYADACTAVQRKLPASAGRWQTVTLLLDGSALQADPWYAKRFAVFSLATESSLQPVDLRSVSLRDQRGVELLANGDFAQGGQRWFFSSDRNHLPWHAKNMIVHLLFEQGWLGLLALAAPALAAAAALWRGRAHPLAPALAGALAGFWVVAMIDSLLDMPRVATLFLLLTAVATMQHRAPRPGTKRAP